MLLPHAVPPAPAPYQLPLPLPPTAAAAAEETLLPPQELWRSLPPPLQLQCRRRLVTLLQEVLRDAPQH